MGLNELRIIILITLCKILLTFKSCFPNKRESKKQTFWIVGTNKLITNSFHSALQGDEDFKDHGLQPDLIYRKRLSPTSLEGTLPGITY